MGRSTRGTRLVGALVGLAAACKEPDAKEPPAPRPPAPPTWDGRQLQEAWRRQGTGEGWAVRAADLDGDGSDELLLAGRGVFALDARSRTEHHARWRLAWGPQPNSLLGGDNTWVNWVEPIEATGDGVPDALVLTADREAYLVDGKTGSTVWRTPMEAEFITVRGALVDADTDGVPDVVPAGASHAYSGRTGQPLWDVPLARPTVFAITAELDGKPGRDVILTLESDQLIGHPEGEPLEQPPFIEAVFGFTGAGQKLFGGTPQGIVTAAAAGDLDGDGVDEAIVGTSNGKLCAYGRAGELWCREGLAGVVQRLAAADADRDGKAEIYAAVRPDADGAPSQVRAFSSDGRIQWTHDVGQIIDTLFTSDLDGNGTPELLIGGGGEERNTQGVALALKLGAGEANRVLWKLSLFQRILSFTRAHVDGKDVLVLSGQDTVVRAVDPKTGQLAWSYNGGGFVFALAAGDLDRDGKDEVVSGDDRGILAVSRPADGTQLWSKRVDLGNSGQIDRVTTGDLDGDGTPEVIAVGARLNSPGARGFVAVYSASGTALLTKTLAGEAMDVQLANLAGDANPELVVAEVNGQGCGVTVLDRTGELVWRTKVNDSCEVPRVSVGDADGDGKPEVAYGDVTLFSMPRIALLDGATGTIRWSQQTIDDTTWLYVVPGGIVHAGFAAEFRGHVSRRSPKDGAVAWTRYLPARPWPGQPTERISAESFFGTLVPDQTGDAVDEIAASSGTGDVYLLSGADGSIQWSSAIESAEATPPRRHAAGPIAYVPASATVPGHLVVGHISMNRMRSQAVVLGLDGAEHGRVDTLGEGHAITPFRIAPGQHAAALGAGLGVYALEVRNE